jgi:(1->4)-alpha-D-glucan 1-alpha-D-glucosylmutase
MMKIPVATYRLQFTPDFGFAAAQAIAPYLSALGISDIYASPILQSRKGSSHGYDGVDPTRINPELGGEAAFEALVEDLQSFGLGWIQDIVPNHMAFDSQNAMLMDVMENGPDSEYRDFFDIDWQHPYEGIQDRVLAPFLGKFYGDCLESGYLQLSYAERGFTINYYGLQFPIRLESYYRVLTYDLDHLRRKLGRDHPDYVKLLGVLYMLKYIPAEPEGRERYDQIRFIKRMLWELWQGSVDVHDHIQRNIQLFNGEVGKPESFDLLDEVLGEQFYRLAYWKVGNEELNYRRFFTVNELICLRVEDESVFRAVHQYILALVKAGKITGLRIDHIDGLYDPTTYLDRLRQEVPDIYLVVEKILEAGEALPLSWPIQGTTGYDFLNQVNGLLCDRSGKAALEETYRRFIGRQLEVGPLIDSNKRLIVDKHLAGDIDNLARMLKQISGRYRYASDFTLFGLQEALEEILVLFPVYRTYINGEGARGTDQELIKAVIRQAKLNIPDFFNELAFIERFLLLKFDDSLSDGDRGAWLHFLMRLQQYTGPLMAKGIEDTVFYIYNRLISLNEVGASLNHFGVTLEDFHGFNQELAAQWPHTMNATATHDTKRGEDNRVRLNVISELVEEWREKVGEWQHLNRS